MSEAHIYPTYVNIEKVYRDLDNINSVDIRNFIQKIYNNWINIYPYFYSKELHRNIDLIKSGAYIDKLISECEEIDCMETKKKYITDKIRKAIKDLKNIYGNNVNIYLYNNNKDSKNVGRTANMDYTCGKCKIFAYIKKNANKEFVSKNELEHIRIFYCSGGTIKYLKETESGDPEDPINKKIYFVKPEDFIVFDNFYKDFNFEEMFVTFKDSDLRILRKIERLKKNNVSQETIESIIFNYKNNTFKNNKDKYSKHLYNYIYFENEIKYYIEKTQEEYLKITLNHDDKSYYRLIYYHYESVKSLNKMFLQRLQLLKYGYFYSSHSWWRSITGFGTTTKGYFVNLKETYNLIMGDLLSKPLEIKNRIEKEFPEKIFKLKHLINNFKLKEPYQQASSQITEEEEANAQVIKINNEEQIGKIIIGLNHVWNVVKDI